MSASISKLMDRCPCTGQIELYTHHPFLPTLVQNLSRMGIRTCAVYLLESQFMEDRYKFFRCGSTRIFLMSSKLIPLHCQLHSLLVLARLAYLVGNVPVSFSGVLSAMSAMVNLEIPWINIMSKMDLVTENADDPAGGARNGIRGRKNIAR
jgi:hypothetical protein